jgi:transposase
MQGAKVYIGIDVGKEWLEAAQEREGRRFGNDSRGRQQLVTWLGQSSRAVQVICEASGGYERELVQQLHQSGIGVSLVQASRVRQFARARGLWAKTDRIDAHLLAQYGEAIGPGPSRALTPEQERLRALDGQRRHLSRLLVMEQNRQSQLREKELRHLEAKLISQIKGQLFQLDELI